MTISKFFNACASSPVLDEPYATGTFGQGPAGDLTICFEKRIIANSLHYQFENEPFVNKKLARAPAKAG